MNAIKILPAPVVAQAYTAHPHSFIKRGDMWVGSVEGESSKKPRVEKGDTSEKKMTKGMELLDYRLRKLEAEVPTWFLPETEGVLVPALKTAHAAYDSKLVKGQAHQDGPRRTTLAGQLLKTLSSCDLAKGTQEQQLQITRMNEMLVLVKQPTLQEQQAFLNKFLATYVTAASFEPFIVSCEAFKAKKNPRYVVQLLVNRHTPLAHVSEFVEFAMRALGAEPQHGPPPRGELFRHLK